MNTKLFKDVLRAILTTFVIMQLLIMSYEVGLLWSLKVLIGVPLVFSMIFWPYFIYLLFTDSKAEGKGETNE